MWLEFSIAQDLSIRAVMCQIIGMDVWYKCFSGISEIFPGLCY